MNAAQPSWIGRQLAAAPPFVFSAYCIVAAFGTYFCMYAFRKPFTAATYEDIQWLGFSYKSILISSQVAGYTLSKFLGIKIVSEMPPRYRAFAILMQIAIAELALLLFAVTPAPWNSLWLFLNGLNLGMVFGLVLGFLEGRRVTEALSAGLCASFILSSGFVKSVGRTLIEHFHVDIFWMPFLTGLIFFPPLLVCVWMLGHIPPPDAADQRERTKREPMGHQQRREFFRRHALGLSGLVLIYVLLTLLRSLRDDFAVEIWLELGVQNKPDVFARSELWVTIGVLVASGLTFLIKNNRSAFLGSLAITAAGFAIALASVWGQRTGQLDAMNFMVLLGLGLYIPYVIFHTTVFERMIAAFHETATIGYLMYLADAIGYLVYVIAILLLNNGTSEIEFLPLLLQCSVALSLIALCIVFALGLHFRRRIPRNIPNTP